MEFIKKNCLQVKKLFKILDEEAPSILVTDRGRITEGTIQTAIDLRHDKNMYRFRYRALKVFMLELEDIMKNVFELHMNKRGKTPKIAKSV